ncbi:hypothetical protein SK128_002078 [Halocaridina rubra]|uniref:Uncharacterized protein n=1 Tax=Halocaridina rubra TaxID=373956 RepID=A0AAN8X993_HALRR
MPEHTLAFLLQKWNLIDDCYPMHPPYYQSFYTLLQNDFTYGICYMSSHTPGIYKNKVQLSVNLTDSPKSKFLQTGMESLSDDDQTQQE